MKEILKQINDKQLSTFCTLKEFYKNKEHYNKLPLKNRGLYWIWTKIPFPELAQLQTRISTQEVPFQKLLNNRRDLEHVCKIEQNSFRLVYNGIGGYTKEPASFGLRERINQEIHCNDYRTGTLNILNRGNIGNSKIYLEDWGVSFFNFDSENNQGIISKLEVEKDAEKSAYTLYAKELELLWRLQYGTPILCRH